MKGQIDFMMSQFRSVSIWNNLLKLRVDVETLLLLFFLCEQPVYAYVDPGTGSMLWQIVVAGFVGMLFYLRRWLGALVVRRKENKSWQPPPQ